MHPRVKIAIFCLAGLLAVAFLGFALRHQKAERNLVEAPSWAEVNRIAAKASPPASSRSSGIPLEPIGRQQKQHIHAAVRLSASGGFWGAPPDMGITRQGEVLAIHTHDNTGVVHLHRPAGVNPFTLGQVLSLWGIEVQGGKILGYPARIVVNGREASLGYSLKNRDDVVIYMPQGPRLPAFDWSRVPLEKSR